MDDHSSSSFGGRGASWAGPAAYPVLLPPVLVSVALSVGTAVWGRVWAEIRAKIARIIWHRTQSQIADSVAHR